MDEKKNQLALSNRLDDKSVQDILAHLPIKSLMRFKCVSKSWQSFIQGSYFVELHLSRSKTHPQLLITIQNLHRDSSSIFSPEDEFIGGVALQKVTVAWSEHAAMLTPIDGLCCFVDYLYGVTCICNLGTRQFTPGAQTSVNRGILLAQFQTSPYCGTRVGEPFVEPPPLVTQKPTYGFGFDPMTKKYKILCVWEICHHDLETKFFLGLGTIRPKLEQICEVFTVGENQWRKIDEAPGIRLSGAVVYANGSIYMRNGVDIFSRPDSEFVVAFDVGSEKFRAIQIPDFIVGASGTVKRDSDRRAKYLLQIDGYMALEDSVDEYVIKLWISDDSYKEKRITTNWTEETIWLPSPFQQGHYPRLIPVQGTNDIIISSQIPAHIDPSPRRFVSVYIYNRTVKSCSQKIDISGVSALLTSPYPYSMYVYHESLVPIQDAEKKFDRPTSLV